MGAKTEPVERSSQATPLAEDVLSLLQARLNSDFGVGVGPLQREAGTAIRQFVNSGGPSLDQIDPTALLNSIEQRSRTRLNTDVAGLRDSFGAAGARFGTQLQEGEGRLRRDVGENLDVITSQALLDAAGKNVQFGLQGRDQLLRGIQQMFQQGTGSMAPFLAMAQQGIVPEEVIHDPGVLGSIIEGVAKLGPSIFDKFFSDKPPQLPGPPPDPAGPPLPPGG